MTIDWWTLGIQTVNVAVLVWLLQRFFWRPVAAMIEQRRDATRRTMAEAEAARAKATAALAEIEATRAGFAKERDAILAEAREAADKMSAAALADAKHRAAGIEATARATIETDGQAAADAWNERSASLAVDIAGHLVARLDGASVHAAFLNWLADEIAALPEATRQAVDGATLEVVSAKALDPNGQALTRERIGKALGSTVSLDFRTDPGLIAGLELHGPHLLVSNSWRADLARIQAGLTATNNSP
jgi:F-type H+-transporting ATPase subunit b